jgi:hypothetical protein
MGSVVSLGLGSGLLVWGRDGGRRGLRGLCFRFRFGVVFLAVLVYAYESEDDVMALGFGASRA